MGDCVPQSKKIRCEHFKEVWEKGEEKKKASLSRMEIRTWTALEGLGAAFEGMFQNPFGSC